MKSAVNKIEKLMKKKFLMLFYLSLISLNIIAGGHPSTNAIPLRIQKWVILTSPHEGGLVEGCLAGFVNGEYMDGDLPNNIDCYWLYATANSANASIPFINIPNISAATITNSPTFTAKKGFTGNGTTAYLDLKYNPAVNAVHFALSSAFMGIYIIATNIENKADLGSSNSSTDYTYIYSKYTGSIIYGDIADNNGTGGGGSVGTGLGMLSVSAISGTTKTYMNKTQITTQSISQTAFASYDLYLLGSNSAGTLHNPCTKQIAAAYLASGNLNLTAMYNNFQQRVATPIGFNQ